MGSGAGLASDTAGTSAFPYVYSLAAAQFLRHVLELGLVLSLEQDRGALWARVPGCGPGSYQTLGWPLALRPALHLSCGQCFLSLGCFLSEWKAMWQARVLGSCPAGGSGYSDVASGHLAVTWSGHDSSLGWPCSHSSFFQNTNSAPGGPKSWAQLNGKPAGHEGGK